MPAASRRLLVLFLLGLVIAAGASPSANGAADVRAAKFIEIATAAQERVLALRALVLANGFDVRAADAIVASGKASLAAALTAYSAEPPDFETAAIEAREAAASFRGGLRLLGEQVADEVFTATEAERGLLDAIANHRRRLHRLNDTIAVIGVSAAGPVPPGTQAQLTEAHGHLMTAEDEFAAAEDLLYASPSDVRSATAHMTAGLKSLQAAFIAFRAATDWTDAWKAEKNLLDPLLRQLDDLQERVDAAEAEGKDTDAVQEKLEDARELYADAEALLSSGDKKAFSEIVKELHRLLADVRADLARL